MALAAMQRWPNTAQRAIMRGQTRATEIIAGRIRADRLTGKGPFPVSEHRLGNVTYDLMRTTAPVAAVALSPTTVLTKITSAAWYANLHEDGYSGEVTRGSHVRRQASRDVRGVRGGRKFRAQGIAFVGRSRPYMLNIPARAPYRTGVTENAALFRDEISRELAASWGQRNWRDA